MLPEFEARHKIKSKLLAPFVFKVNPDLLTYAALVCGIGAGVAFARNSLLPAAFLVLLNGFFDILDGEVARAYGRASKRGDLLDHTLDRFADVAIFTGVALNPASDLYAGFALVVVILVFSYLGALAHSLAGKRLYDGIGGRADRLVILVVFTLASFLFNSALFYGTYVLLMLMVFGTAERFLYLYSTLK